MLDILFHHQKRNKMYQESLGRAIIKSVVVGVVSGIVISLIFNHFSNLKKL